MSACANCGEADADLNPAGKCCLCEECDCSHCGASLDDGEGFDGYCGNCADILESGNYWDGSRRERDAAMDRLEREVEAK